MLKIKKNIHKYPITFLLLFAIGKVFAIPITEIKVNGLTSISYGTVLNYLPLELGDDFIEKNSESSNEIIKSLYKTNFFSNIDVLFENNILTINVIENPRNKKY